MKYKVGDKVKVREDLIDYKFYDSEEFVPDMKALKGKIVTLEHVYKNHYIIKELNDYHWTDEMCEEIEEPRDDDADALCYAFKLIAEALNAFDKAHTKKGKNTVTQEDIDNLIKNADIDVRTLFNKCTLVTVKLQNGFVLSESSACVDPENYDESVGEKICMERIKNKLWELEGYKLQCELNRGADA